MTLGVIGLDIFLRLIAVEKAAAVRWQSDPVQIHAATVLEELPSDSRQQIADGTTSEAGLAADDTQSVPPEHDTISAEAFQEAVASRDHVLLPAILTLLSSRRLLVALWASLVEGAIFAGLESVLPLQTQAVFGWGSEGGGLIFLPLTIPAFLGPIVGSVCDKYGPRWPTFVGFLLFCPSLTLLRFVDHDSVGQKVLLCALLVMSGCCFTLTLDPLMAEVAYVVGQKAKNNPERYGSTTKAYAQAFALFNMAYSLGNTLGPLCAGLVRDAAGWATMSWVLGLMGGVTAILAGLWCGGWFTRKDERWTR